MADSTVTDLTKLKVVDLRKELKSRGLPHTGDKAELIARLQSSLITQEEQGDINLDSDEIDSDGVLEDDDDKIQTDLGLDESAVELALADQSPPSSESPKDTEVKPQKAILKRKLVSLESNKTENKEAGVKKIILNRAISVTIPSPPKPAELSDEKPTILAAATEKVKITADLDAKTRLEMRAKRFGLPVKVSDDERKEARKRRFGQERTTALTKTTAPANKVSLSENLEKLKKRAERFGQSVSKIMTDIEKKELLEKRKQKFGLTK